MAACHRCNVSQNKEVLQRPKPETRNQTFLGLLFLLQCSEFCLVGKQLVCRLNIKRSCHFSVFGKPNPTRTKFFTNEVQIGRIHDVLLFATHNAPFWALCQKMRLHEKIRSNKHVWCQKKEVFVAVCQKNILCAKCLFEIGKSAIAWLCVKQTANKVFLFPTSDHVCFCPALEKRETFSRLFCIRHTK